MEFQEAGLWLEEKALEMSKDATCPVDVHALAASLGVAIKQQKSDSERARLYLLPSGREEIYLRTQSHTLTPRDRFTLAHEIAHVLLYRKFGSAPKQSSSRSEYYKTEDLCNTFAGRLLVPQHVLDTTQVDNIMDAARAVNMVATTCGVSKEVAARELCDEYEGIGYCVLDALEQATTGTWRWEIRWSCGLFDQDLGIKTHRIINSDHPIVTRLTTPVRDVYPVRTVQIEETPCAIHCARNRGHLEFRITIIKA